jgi:hypothetical protein
VLDAAGRAGARVVQASSESTYGFPFAGERRLPEHAPVREDHPHRPEDPLPLPGAVLPADALLGDDDAEALGAVALGPAGGLQDRLRVEQVVRVDPGVEVGRLGTEATVLGAVARLRVHDAARVDGAVAIPVPDRDGARGQRFDRLGQKRQRVGPVQGLPVEYSCDRVVDRPVTRRCHGRSDGGRRMAVCEREIIASYPTTPPN